MREQDLALRFISYFDEGFDVYKEFRDVDIVACCKPIMIAVEVKTSFNFKVIEQALRNKGSFHYSYIAVPEPKPYHFGEHICKDYGIGVLYASKRNNMIHEKVKPNLNRTARFVEIDDIYKKTTAGAKSGNSLTAFKLTVQSIIDELTYRGDIPLEKLLTKSTYHWGSLSSAKSCIMKYCREGVIKEFEIEKGILKLKKK